MYSKNNLFLKSEQIFFLLILPGIDMLRVFIIRILNKKNPFKADSQHLHNLISKKLKDHKKITLIISIVLFVPNLFIILFPTQLLIFVLFYLLVYLMSVIYLHNSK